MKIAPSFLEQGTKIIDLGTDFRLKNKADWENKYDKKHENWSLVEEAVYEITELHRVEIRKARIIANPGCYSSASILAVAPLVKANNRFRNHHPEIANNIVPCNVVDHRHTYEIEQGLRNLSSGEVTVHFTTSYVPNNPWNTCNLPLLPHPEYYTG